MNAIYYYYMMFCVNKIENIYIYFFFFLGGGKFMFKHTLVNKKRFINKVIHERCNPQYA